MDSQTRPRRRRLVLSTTLATSNAMAGKPETIRSPKVTHRTAELGLTRTQLTQPAFAGARQADRPTWQKMIQAGSARVD